MTFVDLNRLRERHVQTIVPKFAKQLPIYGKMFRLAEELNQYGLEQRLVSPELKELLDKLMHSAIRVTEKELPFILRLFAVMGMYSYQDYDLQKKVGVASTYLRPIGEDALKVNGYRTFLSVVKVEYILKQHQEKNGLSDEELIPIRNRINRIIEARNVFSNKLVELVTKHEEQNGLNEEQARAFLEELNKLFLRPKRAGISLQTYHWLMSINKTLAHVLINKEAIPINHFTPCVYSVHAAHDMMRKWGIRSIEITQGPPEGWPLALNQVASLAPPVWLWFPANDGYGVSLNVLPWKLRLMVKAAKFLRIKWVPGKHLETFVEMEARHLSLTPEGFALYEQLLKGAMAEVAAMNEELNLDKDSEGYRVLYYGILKKWFEAFPTEERDLIALGLGYFRYEVTQKGLDAAGELEGLSFLDLYDRGYIRVAERLLYPGFLIVSATGIFNSNLGLNLTESGEMMTDLLEQLKARYALAPELAIFEPLAEAETEKSDIYLMFEKAGSAPRNAFQEHKLVQWDSIVKTLQQLEVNPQIVTGVKAA